MEYDVQIDVLSGRFESQPLAFAHLMDAAEGAGLSPDFDHIEVLAPPSLSRLRGYFDAETARALIDAADGMALILVLPGALIRGQFGDDARLRRLGRFAGRMVRA